MVGMELITTGTKKMKNKRGWKSPVSCHGNHCMHIYICANLYT